jgi:hypothetical protein
MHGHGWLHQRVRRLQARWPPRRRIVRSPTDRPCLASLHRMRRFRLRILAAPSSGSLSVLLRKGASVAGYFVLGARGAIDCPPGSFAITALAHCQAAVLGTPGVPENPTVILSSSSTHPKGCSKSAFDILLNRDPVGGANSDYTPICSSCAVMAAPLATATPSYSNGRRPRRRMRFSGGPAPACPCWPQATSTRSRSAASHGAAYMGLLDSAALRPLAPARSIRQSARSTQPSSRDLPPSRRSTPRSPRPSAGSRAARRSPGCAPADVSPLGFRIMFAFAAPSHTRGCTARCRRASRRSLR